MTDSTRLPAAQETERVRSDWVACPKTARWRRVVELLEADAAGISAQVPRLESDCNSRVASDSL